MEREKARLEAQNHYLQEEIRSEHNFGEIVGSSPALLDVLRQVEQIARIDSTVLILVETGTGKELIARAIHDRSPRKKPRAGESELRRYLHRFGRERIVRPRQRPVHRRNFKS